LINGGSPFGFNPKTADPAKLAAISWLSQTSENTHFLEFNAKEIEVIPKPTRFTPLRLPYAEALWTATYLKGKRPGATNTGPLDRESLAKSVSRARGWSNPTHFASHVRTGQSSSRNVPCKGVIKHGHLN
jgi:hypothetical protein